MFTRYSPDCIHNELNPELNARAIFFADTNKWLDLVMQAADVAACTAIRNRDPEGLQLILAANAQLGLATAEYLEWSPVLAVTGTYKPLMDWFEAKYGRAVWFRWPDASGEWTGVLRQMYTRHDAENEADRGLPVEGWTVVNNLAELGVLPAGADNVLAIANGDLNDTKTNVLVFYELNGVDHFVQRAFSYVATADQGAVWQPVKGELCSVRAIVGRTPLMSGVARYVEQADPAYAKRLVQDGFGGIHKAAVFHAMCKNSTIKAKGGAELPMYLLGSEEAAILLQTPELVSLVTDPANQGRLLELLAPFFKQVMFSVCVGVQGHFSIYLPAVWKQDSNSGFTSAGGLSDLITNLIVQYILGVDAHSREFLQLASRAKAALNNLAYSDGLAKAPARGRMSVQAKTKAFVGIPVGEVWVRESNRPNSVYQTMLKTYKA